MVSSESLYIMRPRNLWFTSDTHFGHRNIIKYLKNRGDDAREMDERIVQAWNSRVSVNDVVWHLGDVCFSDHSILWRLRGKINLIIGNHDHRSLKNRTFVERFEEIYHYAELKTPLLDSMIVVSHFPFEEWNKSRYGSIHLHGHTHGMLNNILPNRMDVGVDTHPELAPYSIDEIQFHLKSFSHELEVSDEREKSTI